MRISDWSSDVCSSDLDGFRDDLHAAGVLGMRVLWFERDHGLYVDPSRWPREAMATTTTHDLPTVAGWWQGRDIDWRAQVGLFAPEGSEHADRAEIGRASVGKECVSTCRLRGSPYN